MNKPQRIQLRRTKGWRMPENTVKVCRPGKWGNYYKVGGMDFQVDPPVLIRDRQHAVECWKRRLRDPIMRKIIAASARAELRGKNLACWCRLCDQHRDGKPAGVKCSECDPCHADCLLDLANE